MPGLVPGIHVLRWKQEDVDGRNKSGHDEGEERVTREVVEAKNSAVPLRR